LFWKGGPDGGGDLGYPPNGKNRSGAKIEHIYDQKNDVSTSLALKTA